MKSMKDIQSILAEYSTLNGASDYSIGGQSFSAHHAFACDGLLPLFVRKAQEITTQLNFKKLFSDTGLDLRKDQNALTGSEACFKEGPYNHALGLLLIVEVIHSQIELAVVIANSNNVGADIPMTTVPLDGMLDTYNLEELNQGRSSDSISPILKAAISQNAVGA